MRISEMLQAIASWLESPNNEALLLAEHDEDCLKAVAESCVEAAHTLRKTAQYVDSLEPQPPSQLTPESIDEIADLANALASSNDPSLQKQASVLDELLLSIAAPPAAFAERKDLQEQRIKDLQRKYQEPSQELHKMNHIDDMKKKIDKSNMTKNYTILEAPLSTRYCPDHPGVQIARIGEHMWQCELDKKSYNFDTGFELNNGMRVPGGDVAQQTQGLETPFSAIFDSRSERLGYNQ